ncbi:MAG: DUF2339 domain-containing protein, partial [Planctomycetota bacterium]|nr:DUF2339 domain-containing protein [Planctomycetota bacterium]
MADSSSNETLGELRESCRRLQSELNALRERIRRIEQRQATPSPASQSLPDLLAREAAAKRSSPRAATPSIESPAPKPQPTAPAARPVPSHATPPYVSRGPRATSGAASVSNAQKPQAVELLVGRTGLNLAGAFILLLAVGFFIKYSFEQGWLSETTRVLVAGLAGLTLVGIGEFCLFRSMRVFAGGLIGCGVGVLYLAAFGAYNYYTLIDSQTAAILYVGVTALSIIVSTHAKLLPIAIMALIGGFWTPFALHTGDDRQVALLTYVLLLDAGFLICALIRRWDVLRPLCWIGTALLFVWWYEEFYHAAAMWRTAGFIFAFYILLHGETLLGLWRGTIRWNRFSGHAIHLNNAVFFGSIYFLMRDAIPEWMGLFAVTTAGLQWLAAWRLHGHPDSVTPARTALWLDGAAILALAAPIQFDRYLVSLTWAIQSAVTFLFCRRHDRLFLRIKATGILIAASIHLWSIDRTDPELVRLIADMGHWRVTWFLIYVVFTGLCAYAGGVLLTSRRVCSDLDRRLAQLTYAIGNLLLLAAFAYQWDRYLATWGWLLVAASWLLATRWSASAAPSALALAVAVAIKFIAWDTIAAVAQGTWAEIDNLILSRS